MTVYVVPILSDKQSALQQLIDAHFPGLVYGHRPDGSPVIRGLGREISVSHSRRFLALTVGADLRRIGVDIEEPRPSQLLRVRDRFLSPAEQDFWADDLLTPWTIKEAVYKAAATEGLPLLAIDARRDAATLADGRRFRINTTVTADYALTTAELWNP